MKCTCVQCGKSFELSDSEIDFYRKKNLHLPKRCKDCRQKNKQKQDMTPKVSNSWSAQGKYDVVSEQDNNKIGKWKYGIIAVAALLLILSIKVSLSVFDASVEGNTYSAEAAQNDSSSSMDSGQSESVSAIQSGQNKVANTTESIQPYTIGDTEQEQITADDSVDSALNDSVNAVSLEQADAPDSTESIPNDFDIDNVEAELISDTEPEQITAADVEAADPIQDSSPVVRQYYFRNAKLLDEHYQKHGIEMGFASAEEYQAAASAVVINENSLHKLEAEDGDDVYYLEATNDFVIVSTDGYIRTYFRPDSGINYYNKQ